MPFRKVTSVRELVVRARRALGLTQQQFAKAIGSSTRTITRLEGGGSGLTASQFSQLAALLLPLDADLARDAAAAHGVTLEQLGLVRLAPPPAPDPPRAPAVQPGLVADTLACAVADALEKLEGAPVGLRHARAAVVAAFGRARELGLKVEDVAEAVGAGVAKEP